MKVIADTEFLRVQDKVENLDKRMFALEYSVNTILEIVQNLNKKQDENSDDKEMRSDNYANSNVEESREWEHIDSTDIPTSYLKHKQKYTEKTFKSIYEKMGIKGLLDDAERHRNFVEKYAGEVPVEEYEDADWWSEDMYKSESLFCQIMNCLEYFDIYKIATQIITINDNLKDEFCIETYGIDNFDKEQVHNSIKSCIKEVCEALIKEGRLADKNRTFIDFQVGRVRLESIYSYNSEYSENNRSIMRLYWTDSFESSNEMF